MSDEELNCLSWLDATIVPAARSYSHFILSTGTQVIWDPLYITSAWHVHDLCSYSRPSLYTHVLATAKIEI